MGLKSNDPFKSAVSPLNLDRPFIAISEYHVEDRVFRNFGHSDVHRGVSWRLQDRSVVLVKPACDTMSEGEHAAVSDEHYQHPREREADEKH